MDKARDFDLLVNDAHACRRCERMCGSIRVLNRGCGDLNAQIMFVGEAPGRLGADVSALPFHGDKAGHNFESLLEFAGLSRDLMFITNAVLCNPRDDQGNNATPNVREIAACVGHLRRQIDVIQPRIVVTLGAVALRACELIEAHGLTLREAVRTSRPWYRRQLIPLYHPGQRAMVHRSMANQRSDYQFVAEQLKKRASVRRMPAKPKADVCRVVHWLLAEVGVVTYFGLHKLFFLLEYEFFKRSGRRLTSGYFVRQKDGPYCVDLHPAKLRGAGLRLMGSGGNLRVVREALSDLFSAPTDIPNDVAEALEDVVSKYGKFSNRQLKTAAYLTRPMRNLLREEKAGRNVYNAPIQFSV